MEWVDPRYPLNLDTILSIVSLWWFTQTFPRSLYHAALIPKFAEGIPHPISKKKPFGYSQFPYDLSIIPKAWAEYLYPNLLFFKAHSKVSGSRNTLWAM